LELSKASSKPGRSNKIDKVFILRVFLFIKLAMPHLQQNYEQMLMWYQSAMDQLSI
jgi:hypothetical protein